MGAKKAGFEFRMKLGANKKRMAFNLDNFNQISLGIYTWYTNPNDSSFSR